MANEEKADAFNEMSRRRTLMGRVRASRSREACLDASIALFRAYGVTLTLPLIGWDIDPEEIAFRAGPRDYGCEDFSAGWRQVKLLRLSSREGPWT